MLLLLTLFACAPTCEDIEDAICADELAALLEADTGLGDGWAWFDAEGRQVTRDAELLWEDEEGVIWQVDPVLAVPYALEVDSRTALQWFESEDCTGTTWAVFVAPPNFAYTADAYDEVWVWSAGSTTPTIPTLNSYQSTPDSGCSARREDGFSAIPWASVDEIDLPGATGWAAPMTIEPR